MTELGKLSRLITALPRIDIQNRLLNVQDRELALAIRDLQEPDRSRIYAAMSPAKAQRLHEELVVIKRLRVRREDQQSAVLRLIGVLEGRPYTEVLRSYVRPADGRGR